MTDTDEDFDKSKMYIDNRQADLLRAQLALHPEGVRIRDRDINNQMTLLHIAARAGYAEGIQILVEHGANVNARAKDARTPLHYAMLGRSEKSVLTLLAVGADPQCVDRNDVNPLHLAIQMPVPASGEAQRLANIQALLGACDSADRPDYDGHDTLHAAAKAGFVGGLDVLLATRGDIEHRDGIGATLLHSAVNGRKLHMIDHLLARGADINCIDYRNATPLHYAVQSPGSNRAEVVGFVLSRGADPDLRNLDNARAEDLTLDSEILQAFAACRARRAVHAALAKHAPSIAKVGPISG